MKKRNIFLTFIFVITISISSFAQGGGIWNFNWDIGFPMGNTNDFISIFSKCANFQNNKD